MRVYHGYHGCLECEVTEADKTTEIRLLQKRYLAPDISASYK